MFHVKHPDSQTVNPMPQYRLPTIIAESETPVRIKRSHLNADPSALGGRRKDAWMLAVFEITLAHCGKPMTHGPIHKGCELEL
jgi:hypothetical protein